MKLRTFAAGISQAKSGALVVEVEDGARCDVCRRPISRKDRALFRWTATGSELVHAGCSPPPRRVED